MLNGDDARLWCTMVMHGGDDGGGDQDYEDDGGDCGDDDDGVYGDGD